ncbi:hypothetical protein M011DRAFT_137711 [Sporormia fimetaria CBS 119925]|uniref:Uncharacterized protein n=1 Tax=Sporormia fimetaria CBS 119925 TaxID=1340428 RepID=A0A6A6V630_9PLEO|nr:hypothetical protein M011DRAFT_137711 [Sporormia fimetaria CBS 119925]
MSQWPVAFHNRSYLCFTQWPAQLHLRYLHEDSLYSSNIMADEFPPFDDIPRDHQDADETPQLSAFHYDDLMNPAPPAPAFLSLVATSAPVAIPGQRSNGMQIAPEPATSSGSATAAAMPVLTTSPRARIAGASTIGVSTQPIQADVDQLLTLIASCLSGRLVQGVRDMTVMLTQSAVQSRSTSINPNLRETELEQHLTRHLKKMLGGDRVYNLGVRPVISIAIGPGHGMCWINVTTHCCSSSS